MFRNPLPMAGIVVLVLLVSCTSQQEYPVAQDALADVQLLDTPLMVPDAAYDAPTPELNSAKLAPTRFDVVARNNTPRAFFMGLVDGMGINMLVHPEVKARISLNLKNVTLEDTLKAMRDIYGYQYAQTSYGYRILPKALQNKMFQLNYLYVFRQGSSGMSVSGGSVQGTTNSAEDGSGTSSNNTVSGLTSFFSGISLDVTPQIGDNNEAILHVHPSVTEVVERNKIITLGNDTYNLPVAFSSIRETDSIIRAASGQVVVIGGLL